ncbi:MAG: AsmA family protein [Bacteroidia bacterium]
MIKKRKRWLKIAGFSLLGILVLPIMVAVVLLWIYQSEIIQYVKQEVRDQYGMNSDIKKSEITIFSDWPNASLLLHEIDLHDTLDVFSDKPFLKAEEIMISLNLIPLLQKKFNVNTINIKKAKIQIWIDSSGQSNVSFLKKDPSKEPATSKNESLLFKNIKLSDIHFIFMDALKHKAIDIDLSALHVNVKREKEKRFFDLNGKCLVNRLSFNTEIGDFLKGRHLEMKKWKGEMSADYKTIHINQANTNIDKHGFDVKLSIKNGGEGLFALNVNTQKLDRNFALSLLTNKLQQKLARFQWTGLIDLEADIKSPLKRGHEPSIELKAKFDNSDFQLGKNKMLLVGIKGLVTVKIPGDSAFSGDMTKGTLTAAIDKATFKNWPLTGHILIENFKNPVLTANASINIPATSLNSGQVNGPWSGTANALLNLQLPLTDVTANNWMERAQRCDVVLKSSDIHYKIKNKESIRLALLAHLNTKMLEIKKCDVTQDGQGIQLSGVVYDFMQKVLNEEDHWNAIVKIKSEHIALENWIDNIKQITEAQPAKKPNAKPAKDKQEMDNIVVEADVKKLSFAKFVATRVKGQLLIKPKSAEIKNLRLNTCNGTMDADIIWKNSRYINGNVKFKHARVKEIFKSFNNFKQELVKAEQIDGLINLAADFSLETDPNVHVLENSLAAVVDLSIVNGRLKNFEPFEKISKYVFKKRNLDDVAFADLKQRFRFDGTLMQIDLMEINSTAFWMYAEGKYDFNGESDIRIQIPWKNLKNIPDDAVFGQQDEGDGRQVKSLFLKAVGPKGDIKISYDGSQGGKKKERKEERKMERKKGGN